MPFSTSWHTLLDNAEELPSDATLLTPLSRKSFRVTDVQEHRLLIEYGDDGGTIPLQRDQFETLFPARSRRTTRLRAVHSTDRRQTPNHTRPY